MTQFYQLGGAERLVLELAERLNKQEIQADILSMYTEDLPGVPEARAVLLEKGIPAVHFLGMRIHPPLASLIPAILRLRRLIREQDYDIVETSMLSPSILASWATRGMRTRHIAGVHQVFRHDRENELSHKFLRVSVRCNRRNRYYAISDYVARHWISYSKTPPQHTRRIYNGIPKDCFLATSHRDGVRKELGLPFDARLTIYVGRMVAYKGIDTLLDAVGPVLEQYNICLLYIGWPDLNVKGTRETIQQMEKRIVRERWGDRIKFLGYRQDVPRLMASSDVLTHPSRMEGFGLTLVEAMAAGLPVVASNVEGIPEVLAGTDSIMVPPEDPEALRESVLRTLNRSSEEADLALAKGRECAEKFRIDTRVKNMIAWFQDILEERF